MIIGGCCEDLFKIECFEFVGIGVLNVGIVMWFEVVGLSVGCKFVGCVLSLFGIVVVGVLLINVLFVLGL